MVVMFIIIVVLMMGVIVRGKTHHPEHEIL